MIGKAISRTGKETAIKVAYKVAIARNPHRARHITQVYGWAVPLLIKPATMAHLIAQLFNTIST